MKKFLTLILIINVFCVQPLDVLAQSVMPEFNPNVIIPDAAFTDTKTFGGPEEIQKFLEGKGSVLANTSPDFLAKLKEPDNPLLKVALDDPHPNLGRQRTAAEIIWDASQSSGLNPQVILVTLNKEQGLISSPVGPDRLQRALNHAMGFDCPDASGCGNLFPGFYYQLFGNVDTSGNRYLGAAKSLMKSFTTPGGRGPNIGGKVMKVGDSALIQNTLAGYDGVQPQQLVTFTNVATAALYRYTPHVFNGNYNFWKFFTSWFKYSNGTLVKSLQDGTLFILQDGTRHFVPDFVAALRHLNLTSVVGISPTEIQNYPVGVTYGPPDNTIVNADGTTYVFIDSVRHPVSPFVIAQKKLDSKKALSLPGIAMDLYPSGPQLSPNDGTILKGAKGHAVYRVAKGVLALFSPFTFGQYKVAKKVQSIPDEELALYTKQGYVTPLDGTLIKGSAGSAAYLVDKQERRPLTDELFKNLGFDKKNVATIKNSDEIASIPLGTPPTPKEGTHFVISGSQELYLFKNGAAHPIFPFVAKQLHIKPEYSFEASIVSGWPDGIAIPPANNTLVMSDAASTIYVVINGQLREVTPELFSNLGFKKKDVVVLPDSQISVFAKGDFALPRDNTYFTEAETGTRYLFKDGATHEVFPLVAKQLRIKPVYTFSNDITTSWPDGTAIPPRDSTLVKNAASSTIYLVEKGVLREVTPELFDNLGFRAKNVVTFPANQVDAFPKDGFAVPRDETYFTVKETGELYLFQQGATRVIIPLVAKQRNMTADTSFEKKIVSSLAQGLPVAPINNTLIKSSTSPTVYIVVNKKLQALSAKTVKRRGYKAKNIHGIPQADLDVLLQGGQIKK